MIYYYYLGGGVSRSGFKAVSVRQFLPFCEEPMVPVLKKKKKKLERFQFWVRVFKRKQNSSLVHGPNMVDDHKFTLHH
jgi:hypothetical protein